MSRRFFYISLGILALGVVRVGANPVPDDVANEFKGLIVSTAQAGKCPDVPRLARHFGRFGLSPGLLSPSELKAIETRFDVFASILVESQKPGNALSRDIQDVYRVHADTEQRENMLVVLREWLTEPMSEAPPSGSMQITGPESAVRERIMVARAGAAEMLADWGDTVALPLMKALTDTDTSTVGPMWRVRRAEKRLADPCAMTIVLPLSHWRLRCCQSEVDSAKICRGGWERGDTISHLTAAESREVLALIGRGHIGTGRGWGCNYSVVLKTKDGVVGSLSPEEKGRTVYTDNTSFDLGHRLTIQSDELWQWIWDAFHREMGPDVH